MPMQKRGARASLYLAAGMLAAVAAIVMRRGDAFHVTIGVILLVAAASIVAGFLVARRERR